MLHASPQVITDPAGLSPGPLQGPGGENSDPTAGLDPEAVFDLDLATHVGLVRRLLEAVSEEAIYRGLVHDRSKGKSPEREFFIANVRRLHGLQYGSPEYASALADLGPALEHHYRYNSHHPQHYARGISGMTLVDLVEMFCDWCAATRNHATGNIDASIAHNSGRFGMGPVLTAIFENTAAWLRTQGHIGADGKPPLTPPPAASRVE